MKKTLGTGKWALITGASKGLGKQLAVAFALGGYNIIINARDKKGLKETQGLISSSGRSCVIVSGDICQNKTINKLAVFARKHKISLLINNAGTGDSGPLKAMADSQIKRVIITNLIAPIQLTRKIHQFFLDYGKGGIIFINSLSGLRPQLFRSVYCAAKWGLRGFAKAMRLESGKNNIRILSVYPSRIKTRPEFTYGMDALSVAKKIFTAYKRRKTKELVIDGRPK